MYTHRHLLIEMARREITDRYAGQILGVFWAVGHPIFLMLVYMIVFGLVFNSQLGGTAEEPYDYSVFLLCGLIPWLTFSEALNKAPTAVTSSAGLVKQVIFPLSVLPIKSALACLFSQVISTLFLMAYVLIRFKFLMWTYCLIPVVLLFQTMAMIGTSFLLAALGVFFRDLKDIVQVFCTANFFAMPMIYVPTALPGFAEKLLLFNPFSHVIWCNQDVFFFGAFMHPWSWVIYGCGSVFIFLIGYSVYARMEHLFANVL